MDTEPYDIRIDHIEGAMVYVISMRGIPGTKGWFDVAEFSYSGTPELRRSIENVAMTCYMGMRSPERLRGVRPWRPEDATGNRR